MQTFVKEDKDMKEINYYKDLLYILTKKEIKVRYKNSYFGYFWSLLNPLAFAFIFYFVFGIIMRMQMENYSLFLITGLFPWQWISNSLNASTMIYISNASVIKKINFPRNILPLANTLQDMFHFICAIPIVIVFLLMYNEQPSWSWLYGVPILLAIQCIMVFGLSMMLSSLNLFFRDLQQIANLVLMFAFYPTPILYPVNMVPEKYQHLMDLNIFTPIIICWRKMFLKGSFDSHYLILSIIYSISSYVVGLLLYKKLRYRFAEVI